jgi:hypothetical protein
MEFIHLFPECRCAVALQSGYTQFGCAPLGIPRAWGLLVQEGRLTVEDDADRSSFERLLRPLRRELSADLAAALLRMQADEETQSRYEELAGRNTEDRLTPEEQRELASLVRANLMVGVLKAEARAFLLHQSAA